MSTQELLNWIVLCGAAVMAIWNILKAFGKVGSKTKTYQENLIKKVIKKEIPYYLESYSQSLNTLRDSRVEEITQPIFEGLDTVLNERFDSLEQKLDAQKDIIIDLQNQHSDFLRRELKKVYYKYRPYKKISQYDFDDCQKMMENYTGNSYARRFWDTIKTWEIVADDDFLE